LTRDRTDGAVVGCDRGLAMKKFFIVLIVVGGLAHWWTRAPASVAVDSPPPTVSVSAPSSERGMPIQRSFSGNSTFAVNGHEMRPLAEYAVTARVLSSERYHADRAAQLSPMDLALGWGNMSRPSVADRVSVSQGRRWYHWRYSGTPPIPHDEISRSSANVHIIPASKEVARILGDADKGSVVSLRG